MRSRLFLTLPLCVALAACQTNTVELPETPEQIVQFEPVGNTIEDARHGREVAFAITALSGAEDISANGMATLHRFSDKATIIGMRLNIEPAPEGFFYEARLEKADGSQQILLGVLKNAPGDARHTLTFETKEPVDATLLNVRIFQKEDAAREQPGQLMATGVLKVTRR